MFQPHMGLGPEESEMMSSVKQWPFWKQVAAGVVLCVVMLILIGWLI